MTEIKETNFWKTPEGKIISYAIHEHNSGLGYIMNNLSFIKLLIENKNIEIKGTHESDAVNEKTLKDFHRALERIKDGKVKCKDSMDYVYTKLKELQGL